jgi:hypothetical protein
MTLTIKDQIDGLLAYAEYQEAQIEALCERTPACAQSGSRMTSTRPA